MSRFFNNSKVLIFIISVLLILNIVLILFFFCTKPGCKRDEHKAPLSPREVMSRFLKNEIKFSAGQMQRFDSLKDVHRKEMKPLFKGLNAAKDNFYLHISDEVVNDPLLNNGLDSIALRQKMLDREMFHHFRDIRKLCTPQQLPLYDSLVQDLIKKMMNPYRKLDKKNK